MPVPALLQEKQSCKIHHPRINQLHFSTLQNRLMRYAFYLLCFLFFYLSPAAQPTASRQLVVRFKPTTTYRVDQNKKALITSHTALAQLLNKGAISAIWSLVENETSPPLRQLDLIAGIHLLQVKPGMPVEEVAQALRETGAFVYVEVDQQGSGGGQQAVVPGDTHFDRQWSLYNNGTFNSLAVANADIDMDFAWSITTGNNNTIVCILDSGLKLDHPEFAGRLWANTKEIPGNNIDDDANGYVDDINGWDWVNNDNNPTDDHGHGTNVTGILAANGNNNIGYAGINWKCKVMVGKILNASNSGFYSWWVQGIYYAVRNGAKVINMSVGGSGFSQAMKEACDFAEANNVTIFACSMNTGSNTTYYPAGYASTIAIGATNVDDSRASFSNFGSHLDLVAPGVSIYGLSHTSATNYNSAWSGTSQATPHAAGTASLLYGLKPDITPAMVKSILQNSAKDRAAKPAEDVAGWDEYTGAGRLNAFQALNRLLAVLPVSLSRFEVQPGNGSPVLLWENQQEKNILRYEVESNAGSGFRQVGTVAARRSGDGSAQLYTFTHRQPPGGVLLYRLKMIDTDGTYCYSKILSVTLPVTTAIKIHPNPATTSVVIGRLPGAKDLTLTDATGRVVKKIAFGNTTEPFITLPVQDLPAGMYLLTMGGQMEWLIKQ